MMACFEISLILVSFGVFSNAQSGGGGGWIEDLIPPLSCIGGDGTPLKCDPGDVLRGTTVRAANETLQSVLWNAAGVNPKVALALSALNNKDLEDPRWYIHEGEIHTVPPFSLSTGRTLLLLFEKGEFNGGVAGVLSYYITDTDYRLAILYRISEAGDMMNFNIKSYPQDYSVDENLYYHMLDSAGSWTPTEDWSVLQAREEYGIAMEITMSPVGNSRMIARLDTRDYDPSLGPNTHLSCEYRDQNGYDDYYCKKECIIPLGECFTEIRCQSVDNCSQDFACSQGC